MEELMTRTLPALAGLLLLAAAALPAQAGLDIDFGASLRIGDDTDLYVAINSRYFDRDRDAVRSLSLRYRDPDDLAVALFIGRRSGRSSDAIWALRRQGLSWWDISLRFGVPADVWFVEVPRRPGPPYGKAYGHWKKHQRGRRQLVLSDADLRNLVAVRMLHEYYEVPVEVAMDWRSGGRDLCSLMSGEYDRRHARPGSRRDGQDEDGDRHDSRGGHPGRGHGRKPGK